MDGGYTSKLVESDIVSDLRETLRSSRRLPVPMRASAWTTRPQSVRRPGHPALTLLKLAAANTKNHRLVDLFCCEQTQGTHLHSNGLICLRAATPERKLPILQRPWIEGMTERPSFRPGAERSEKGVVVLKAGLAQRKQCTWTSAAHRGLRFVLLAISR